MSSLQDTYTSSEEEDYVFEEPNKEVQHVAKKVEVKPVAKKIEKYTEEVTNKFSFELDEDESDVSDSDSEYEEVVVRKKVKKKSNKNGKKKSSIKRKSSSVKKELSASKEDEDIVNLTNFVNQFEGIDPFNFQMVAPGQ